MPIGTHGYSRQGIKVLLVLLTEAAWGAASFFASKGAGFLIQILILFLLGEYELGQFVLTMLVVNLVAVSSYSPFYSHIQTIQQLSPKSLSSLLCALCILFGFGLLLAFIMGELINVNPNLSIGGFLLAAGLALEGFFSAIYVRNGLSAKLTKLNVLRGIMLLSTVTLLIILELYSLSLWIFLYALSVLLFSAILYLSQRTSFAYKIRQRYVFLTLRALSPLYISFFCSSASIWIVADGIKTFGSVEAAGIFGLIFAVVGFLNSGFQMAGMTILKYLRSQQIANENAAKIINLWVPWSCYVGLALIAYLVYVYFASNVYVSFVIVLLISGSVVSLKQSIAREATSSRIYNVSAVSGLVVIAVVLFLKQYYPITATLDFIDFLLVANLISGIVLISGLRLQRKKLSQIASILILALVSLSLYYTVRLYLL